ncbi:MAG: protein kinase [Vulcanimicrobiota bacterium]
MNTAEGLTGQVIDGKLEVKELIGEGGMGAVYRVRHWEWNVDLALKSAHPQLLATAADRERWINEAHTWVDLGLHPNIVPCWFVREFRGIPVLLLDYLPGGSLKELMEQGRIGRDDWDRILDLMIQASDGLGYAHERDLVHRDVKPANMLIDSKGNLCVTDFGLAKAHQDRSPSNNGGALPAHDLGRRQGLSLTATGTLMGTPHYAAPEQWMNGHVGKHADIYALGVLFYELATGRHPFVEPGVEAGLGELVTGHLQTIPKPPKELNPRVPSGFNDLILECLAKDAGQRPESLRVVRERLAEVYQQVTGKAYGRPIPQAATERADALNNKAVSLWSLGERQQAFSAWSEASALDSLHPETNYNRSVAHWTLGRLSPLEVERKLAHVRATHRRAGAYLGYFRLARCQASGAVEEFERALEDPTLASDGAIWKALGDARMSLCEFDKAEEAYSRALERIPEDRDSQKRLEMARAHQREDLGQLVFPLDRPSHEFHHYGGELMVGDSEAVALAGEGRLEKFDLTTGLSLWAIALEGPLGRLELHGDVLAHVQTSSGCLLCWKTGRLYGALRDGTKLYAMVDEWRGVAGQVSLKVIDIRSGASQANLLGHEKQVGAAAVSRDGSFIVSGSFDRTARLWKTSNGQCLSVFRGHTHFVDAVAVKSHGALTLTGGRDRSLRLWLPTGECVGVLPDHPAPIVDIRLTHDEQLALVSCRDEGSEHCVVWELTNRTQVLSRPGRLVHHSAERLWLANEELVSLWGLPGGVQHRELGPNPQGVLSVAGEGRLAVASRDGKVRVWELPPKVAAPPMIITRSSSFKEAEAAREQFTGHFQAARRLIEQGQHRKAHQELTHARQVPGYESDPGALTLQAELMAALPRTAVDRIWERQRVEEPGRVGIRALSLSADGCQVLSVAGRSIRVWNMTSGSCLRGLNGHRGEVYCVAVSDDVEVAISGGSDRTLRVWKPATGQCLKVYSEATDSVVGVALTPDGRLAAASDKSGRTRIYDLEAGTCRWVFKTPGVESPSLSLDGSRLLTLAGKGQVWDTVEGRPLELCHVPRGDLGLVTSEGRFVLTADASGSIYLWDYLESGMVLELEGHEGPVVALAASRDGLTLATAGRDRTIKIWDVAQKKCLRTMSVSTFEPTVLALSPEGRVLIAGDAAGGIRQWEFDWTLEAGRKVELERLFPPPGPIKRFLRRLGGNKARRA